MKDQSENNNDKKSGTADYTNFVLRAVFDAALLLLKTILVMNSGALVTILMSVARSDNSAIVGVLIGASTYFGYGLTAALIGALFYHPYMGEIEELNKYYENKMFSIIISALSLLFSVVIFLWGVWDVISGLKEALISS